MNADEQKERHTAVTKLRDDLTARMESAEADFLALLVQANNDRVSGDEKVLAAFREAHNTLRDYIIVQESKQRDYVDAQDRNHAQILLSFVMLPLWRRWLWCLCGARFLQWVDRSLIDFRNWRNS